MRGTKVSAAPHAVFGSFRSRTRLASFVLVSINDPGGDAQRKKEIPNEYKSSPRGVRFSRSPFTPKQLVSTGHKTALSWRFACNMR
jgi:hypothetical protein